MEDEIWVENKANSGDWQPNGETRQRRDWQRKVECKEWRRSVRVWINKFSAGERCLLQRERVLRSLTGSSIGELSPSPECSLFPLIFANISEHIDPLFAFFNPLFVPLLQSICPGQQHEFSSSWQGLQGLLLLNFIAHVYSKYSKSGSNKGEQRETNFKCCSRFWFIRCPVLLLEWIMMFWNKP